MPEPDFVPDLTIKLIALFAGFIVFALLALHDLLHFKGKLPL
jgi:hypothetical protein